MEEAGARLIEGERAILRPARWGFAGAELQKRFRWSRDDVLQYWSGSIPGGRTFDQFAATVGQRDWPADGKRISYAIYTDGNCLIGMVSCYNIERSHDIGELGIYLGEKEYWGRGYGTDALITFLRHLFLDLGFHEIYLHTYESNVRAQRSYVRAGFHETDKRRRYSARLGYHHEVRMALTAEDFQRLHGASPAHPST